MAVGDGFTPYRFDGYTNEYSHVEEIPSIEISMAHPNPFNPITNISYTLNEPSNIKVSVYDISGRLVNVIENSYKPVGDYFIRWNADNHASGIYYVQIQSNNRVQTQKVVLLK